MVMVVSCCHPSHSTACATCCSDSLLHSTGSLLSFFPFGCLFLMPASTGRRSRALRQDLKGSKAINPQRWETGGSQRDPSLALSDVSGFPPGPWAAFHAGVRGAYAERLQHAASTCTFSPRVASTRFCSRFRRISRFSSISKILGLSESSRQSLGWHNLDENLAS